MFVAFISLSPIYMARSSLGMLVCRRAYTGRLCSPGVVALYMRELRDFTHCDFRLESLYLDRCRRTCRHAARRSFQENSGAEGCDN